MNNNAPSLFFGEKFKQWTPQEQIAYLKKLAASQNQALDEMQKDRDRLVVENRALHNQIVNAEDALHIQKGINQAAILKQNADVQEAGARIVELQARLREVG